MKETKLAYGVSDENNSFIMICVCDDDFKKALKRNARKISIHRKKI